MHRLASFLVGLAGLAAPIMASALGISVVVDGTTIVFKDVSESSWYSTYVRQSAEAGIVNGYKDTNGKLTGEFGPSNDITLAEALKIAVEGAGYDEQVYASTVTSGVAHWSSPYMSVAKVEAFPEIATRARLDSKATRAEVAALIVAAFRIDTTGISNGNRYSDVDTSTSHSIAIEALSRDDVVMGDTDIHNSPTGTFRPTSRINRAEVAKIVVQARAKYGTPGAGRAPAASSSSVAQ